MKEEIVVALLESASNRVCGNNTGARDIRADIEDKKAKIKDSLSTLEEAKQQYENLQTKMKRLDNLEDTLSTEIKSFKEKIDRCRSDISEKFDRVEYQKDYYKAEEKKMQENMKFLVKNKDNYEKLVKVFNLADWFNFEI
jgi:predicted  nucleic acid-binding Zn-ribbon protein